MDDGWDLVTGGGGFLGRALVARLQARGAQVAVVDDLSTPGAAAPPGVRFLRANLADAGGRAAMTAWVRPESVARVWHLASPASPRLYKARQVETLRLGGEALDVLLQVALEHDARLLFASSSEVYGDPVDDRQSESDPTRVHPTGPRGMYDLAKAYGEALCASYAREHGVDARIVRPFNTYGPGQIAADGRLVPSLVYAALTGTPFLVHGDGLQTRTLGYVDDTVEGFMIVMDADQALAGHPVNVGGETTISVLDLAQLVQRLVGRFPLLHGPPQDEHDPRRRRPDLLRIRSLGWSPTVGLAEGIGRTAEWMAGALGALSG